MTVETAAVERRSMDAARLVGIAAYVVALVLWIKFFGLPKQSLLVAAFLGAATVAWDVRRPAREHLDFLRDWWPVFALLTFYLMSRGLSDNIGLVSVHRTEPIDFDRWLFGGTLPTEWLQAHLCGAPCTKAIAPRWYDVLLTCVYYTHFFASLTVAVLLWKRSRPEWVWFMRRYLTVLVVTVTIYVLYPMAPPWMAARDGLISSDVSRITSRGFFNVGAVHAATTGHHQSLSAVGNQVAAMPSLHTGLTVLIAWWGISRLRSPWRFLLLAYPPLMAFMLVYYGEHYVLDALAAVVMVALVMAGWSLVDRLRASRGGPQALSA
ncbi:phosphatase PAP2 family protein [Nocardioides montaniterrae]